MTRPEPRFGTDLTPLEFAFDTGFYRAVGGISDFSHTNRAQI